MLWELAGVPTGQELAGTLGSGLAHLEDEETPCTLRGALSVPCSLPWSIAVTSSCCAHRPLLTLQQLIPAGMLESPFDTDSGLEKQSLGGLQPPRLPSWVWGMGSVLWSRHPAPCALLNVEFVFLCFSCSPLLLHFYFSFGNMASIPGVGIS